MLRIQHPDDQALMAFCHGRIDEDRWDEVCKHLSECETCCDCLDGITDDVFVERARAGAKALDVNIDQDDPGEPSIPGQLQSHSRYQIIKRLGEGGMGVVYAADHRLMERQVALKVLRPRYVSNSQTVSRFREEVKSAAKLSHPNIVTAYDADHAGDLHFLVMEYVEGETLDQFVERRGSLSIGEACQYVAQAAAALEHAHEHGMVHRDIKPHNLMLTAEGRIKVLDFGLARLSQQETSADDRAASTASTAVDSSLTSASTLLGTPDYMAPEQAKHSSHVDIRADIYGLGCTLYHLLTGQPPLQHASDIEKVTAKSELTPQPLRSLRGDIPKELVSVIERMMAVDPDDRFQTPADVAKALEQFATPQKSRSRSRILSRTLVVMGGLLAVAVATLIYFNTGQGQLVIDVKQPGVEVTLDGKRLDVRSGNDSVSVEVGEHELVATKDGFEAHTRRFRLFRGQRELVTVRLDPVPGSKPDAASDMRRLTDKVAAEDRQQMGDDGANLTLSDTTNPSEIALLQEQVDAERMAFTRDGRLITCGMFAVVWDIQAAQKTSQFRLLATQKQAGLSAMELAPDDVHLAVATWDINHAPQFAISLFDIRSGERVRRWSVDGEHRHTDVITGLAYSPNGSRIATCGRDGWVRVWDANSGKHVVNLRGLSDPDIIPFEAVAFLPNGRIAAAESGGGRDVVIWDVENGERQIVDVPHDVHYQLGVSSDGRRMLVGGVRSGIATGTNRGRLTLIDLNTYKAAALDHGFAGVHSVALSPDGRTGLSGHFDGTVRVWDLDNRRLLHEFKGHGSRGRAAALSADGKLAAHLVDDRLFVFPLSPDEIVNDR